MPFEIRVPRLGWSMEEGKFIGWLKQRGEEVRVGDPLFELESEKAVQPVESVDAGRLHIPPDAPVPGSVVTVGSLLGYLLVPGEPIPEASSTPVDVRAEPRLEANVPETNVHARDCYRGEVEKAVASPRARRVARELGVDWTKFKGTGRGGRVREANVRAAAGSSGRSTPAGTSPRRMTIADRLRLSRERTVPVTLTTTADATNLVALRAQFKSAQARLIPSFTDILACLLATVLKRHPRLAVTWDHDQRSLIPRADDPVQIGIAVDTPEGLLVAVLRDVGRKSLLSVAEESRTLIDRARSGRLTAAEMQGGVLTITNLGPWGIDAFTPVINYPEIVILGLGAIRKDRVVLPDDRTVIRERLTLSLTFDHAAVDGAPAAAFLRDIAGAIENLAAHLLGG